MYYNVYFSPTGGTKKVADILCAHLNGDFEPLDLCADISSLTLAENDVCLISVPSYGGRVPATCVNRLQKISANGTKAILNCVYGNRHWDDTLTELQDILESLGFICVCALATVAEHSLFPTFAVGRPNENDVSELAEFAEKIQSKLDSNAFAPLVLAGNHGTYKEFNGTGICPKATENCISCGLCAKNCPANAISFDNLQTADSAKCITCMRCVKRCPANARQLDAEFIRMMSEKLAPALGGYKKNHLFL